MYQIIWLKLLDVSNHRKICIIAVETQPLSLLEFDVVQQYILFRPDLLQVVLAARTGVRVQKDPSHLIRHRLLEWELKVNAAS